MEIKKFINEEVHRLHEITLLESEKKRIEEQLGLTESSSLNLIFNGDGMSQKEAIEYLKTNLEPLVPVVRVSSGALGDENIMLLVCFDPRETWANGILENSNYFRMAIDESGAMEVFTASLYQKGAKISSETRLPVKFRKVTAKSIEDAKNRIVKLIDTIKEYYK